MNAQYHADSELSHISFKPVVNGSSQVDAWQGGKGWKDGYTARKVVFADGQMEVSVCREKSFVGPAIVRKPRSNRGESENRESNEADAAKAAKKRVRQACKTIGADRMVTLTYRENVVDRERALKDWDLFRRRLRKYKDFHYVAVMENQKRGAIHFHIAVCGRQDYFLLRSLWYSVLGGGVNGISPGQVHVRNPSDFGFGRQGLHKLAAYIAKYCGKDMAVREFDQKRFFTSRGIPMPVVESWRIFAEDQLGAVNAAVAIVMDGNLDGAVWWCNNALKVVWCSTAPGRGGGAPVPF